MFESVLCTCAAKSTIASMVESCRYGAAFHWSTEFIDSGKKVLPHYVEALSALVMALALPVNFQNVMT